MDRYTGWFVVMIGCALTLWTGCGGIQNHDNQHPTAEADPQITMFEALDQQLAFGQPDVHRGTFEPLRVVISVRATENQPQRVQYRFEYFDRSGRPMRPSMDWRYLLLPIGGERIMEGSALDTAAVDWRLEVRRAK